MRAIVTPIVVAAVSLSSVAHGANGRCATLQLEAHPDRVALIERVARADGPALTQAQIGFDCFTGDDVTALGSATGEYFDSKPREYLETIFGGGPEPSAFIESLTVPPSQLNGDIRAEMALLARRVGAIDANADLFTGNGHEAAIRIFQSAVDRRLSPFAEKFPMPATWKHPLLGVDVQLDRAILEPVPLDFLTLADQARTAHLLTVASLSTDGYRTTYVVVDASVFAYAPGESQPHGLEPFEAWIERVDERKPREVIEVLGPASGMFSNPKIPPRLLAEICDQIVYVARRMLDPQNGLQQALDERIAREPDAGFPKPLRDALQKAGFDVRKYRKS